MVQIEVKAFGEKRGLFFGNGFGILRQQDLIKEKNE